MKTNSSDLNELIHKKVMAEANKEDFQHTSEAKAFLIWRSRYWREKLTERNG